MRMYLLDFFLDKNMQLMEFVAQIRSSTDLQTMYDSVQTDSTVSSNEVPMNVEWPPRFRLRPFPNP